MSEIPADLKYTESHEWVRDDGNGVVTVGITDHAQALLGDLVFVEIPEVGAGFTEGDACAVVESVKAASDIYSPLEGEIVEVNEELADSPESINDSPYEEGWIFKLKLSDPDSLGSLMDAESYADAAADE